MKIRKILCCLTAAMMMTAAGCRSNPSEQSGSEAHSNQLTEQQNKPQQTDVQLLSNSYRTQEILEGEHWMTFTAIGNLLLFTEEATMQSGYKLMAYNPQTQERRECSPKSYAEKQAGNQYVAGFIPLPDGKIGLVCNEYHEEKGSGYTIIRRCMEVYDEQFSYVETQEIPMEFAPNQILHSHRICMDAEGNRYCLIATDNGYVLECYNSNYEKYGDIAFPADAQLRYLFNGGEGNVFVCSINKTDSGFYYEVFAVDAQERTQKNIGKTIVTRGKDPAFLQGTQGYDFYYFDDYGLYGVKGKEIETVISWINSDIPIGYVMGCAPLADGTFQLLVTNTETQRGEWRIASQRSQEELKNVEVITLSTVGMYEQLKDAVLAYNRAESGCRIIVQDYADYNTFEDGTLGMQKLREDLLDGVVADMVCTDGLNFESLAGKGLFADWYDLMDADAEFQREDYLTNFFESYEYDGKLQRLGASFTILTGAAKTEFAGEKQGCTMAELMAMEASLPQGMRFSDDRDRSAMLTNWLEKGQNCAINRVKAECYFADSDFARLLELIKEQPEQLSPEHFSKEEWDEINADDPYIYAQDRAFYKLCTIAQPMDYHAMKRTVFGDAPITLLGCPMQTDAGNGGIFDTKFTISVNAQSEHRDAVWSFMKYLLSEKYQKKLKTSMPVHRGVLEQKLELATKQVTAQVLFGVRDVNIGAAAPETMEELYRYIEGIRTCYYYDATVHRMLQEETDMFLAGDQSAEQATRMMQSRVSIYLSEQS